MTSLLPVRQRGSCYLLLRQKHNGRCSAGQALWWYSLSAHPRLTRIRREPWSCKWQRLIPSLPHNAWIIFRRAIAAAAVDVVICLFFTLSWRIADRANLPCRTLGAGGGGDTAPFPRSQRQSCAERATIGSPSPAPGAQRSAVGWLPGLLCQGSWAMLPKDGKEAVREPVYVFS